MEYLWENGNLKVVKMSNPLRYIYAEILDDLHIGQLVLTPTGKTARITKFSPAKVDCYAQGSTAKKDPFDRVHLTPLDAYDDTDRKPAASVAAATE